MTAHLMYLEILFHDKVKPNDLELLRLPTHDRPGRARLNRAWMGPIDPQAPNSQPVLSSSGAKIGYLFDPILFDSPPFDDTYQLMVEEEVEEGQ